MIFKNVWEPWFEVCEIGDNFQYIKLVSFSPVVLCHLCLSTGWKRNQQ